MREDTGVRFTLPRSLRGREPGPPHTPVPLFSGKTRGAPSLQAFPRCSLAPTPGHRGPGEHGGRGARARRHPGDRLGVWSTTGRRVPSARLLRAACVCGENRGRNGDYPASFSLTSCPDPVGGVRRWFLSRKWLSQRGRKNILLMKNIKLRKQTCSDVKNVSSY